MLPSLPILTLGLRSFWQTSQHQMNQSKERHPYHLHRSQICISTKIMPPEHHLSVGLLHAVDNPVELEVLDTGVTMIAIYPREPSLALLTSCQNKILISWSGPETPRLMTDWIQADSPKYRNISPMLQINSLAPLAISQHRYIQLLANLTVTQLINTTLVSPTG